MAASAARATLFELEGVAKRYGQQLAVADLSLSIEKGEFIALMGPSGCGKTTTLRMIAGLDRPTAGDIRLSGRSLVDEPAWRRDTPLVWQNYALFPFLTVRKNVEFGLKQRRAPDAVRRAKAEEWMRRMGIFELAERAPGQLSGGQRQRVALARALATEPEVLLLDEPLSSLDPYLKIKMQSELVRLHRDLGITFICVTHSHSEAFAMADRVVIMNAGRIEQIGAPRDIYRRAKNRFVAEFIGGNNILSGRVRPLESGKIVVETAAGAIVVEQDARGTPAPVGEATLVVPADRVAITREARHADNEIRVSIETLEFAGTTVTVFLTTPDGAELQTQLHLRDLEALSLQVGESVIAHWSPCAGYFLES